MSFSLNTRSILWFSKTAAFRCCEQPLQLTVGKAPLFYALAWALAPHVTHVCLLGAFPPRDSHAPPQRSGPFQKSYFGAKASMQAAISLRSVSRPLGAEMRPCGMTGCFTSPTGFLTRPSFSASCKSEKCGLVIYHRRYCTVRVFTSFDDD